MLRRLAGIVLCLGCMPLAAFGQRPHTIYGRVATDSGAPVPLADVIVTIVPSAETVVGKSDSTGAYRVTIAHPTGDYVLYVSALGRKPFRQRVAIAPPDTSALVNVKLAPATTTVATVRVQARRPRPPRSLGNDGSPGADGTDKTVDGVNGALSPDLLGNLDAMATLIPGLATGPLGTSAYGMSSDNNSATLNGLAFSGSDFPRDARTVTRFRTSPWDPTIGGFSGVQSSTTLATGGNVATRLAHITLDAPALQFSDQVAAHTGQEFTNLALDEGGTGPFRFDRFFYNFGLHVARRVAPETSLLDLDPDALSRADISPDSAARLVQTLGSIGVPTTASGIPNARRLTTGSFMERFDIAPAPAPALGAPGPTRAITTFARVAQSDAVTLTPTITPAYSGKTSTGLFGVQALYSRYFGASGDYVSETTSGLSLSANRTTPYAALPGGSVVVISPTGTGLASFGGNSGLANDSRNWTWETVNQTGFLAAGHESLPVKVYLQSRLDGFDQSTPANTLGRYTFNSLDDVANGEPATYSRTLNAPRRSGGEWAGAGAFGGNWIHDALTLTGGLRVDGNAFTSRPAYNPEIDQLFGVRTDHAPDGASLSPRLGFVWKYTGSTGYLSANTGTAYITRGLSQLRGGIGRFRSNLPVTMLGDAEVFTGLPGGMRQLLCVGSATPAPAWQTYQADPSTIPSTCAGGTSTFVDSAPAVTLIDRHYSAPESWRANLGWTSTSFLGAYVALDGTYSMNINQPGTIDLNFAGQPQFSLADEGNRPVFVDASRIVPATGALTATDARVSSAYGQVTDRVSDLRSYARQLTAYLMPNLPFTTGVMIVSYTYSDARAQARGFDGAAGGDPRAVEWSPSAFTPRHQFTVQIAKNFMGGNFGVSTLFHAASGFTFTPLVDGDVDGDGRPNDRAFIFSASNAPDSNVAAGLRMLLQSGPQAARDCLSRQAGRLAARNSCVAPWGATMNATVSFFQLPRTNRARVFINFANVPGGIDELLHGSAKLHGWGVTPLPDATLYEVRGFDPLARQFTYEVNPHFGSSSPGETIRRLPFRITLDVQVSLARPVVEQQLEQNVRVRPALVGTRAPADTIEARYLRTSFTDIYAMMFRLGDSLALSSTQVAALQRAQAKLRVRADSIYRPLAAYLAGLPMDFDTGEAMQHVRAASDAMWKVIYAESPFLLATLTRGQVRLLPDGIRDMVSTPNPTTRFFFF